MRFYGKLLIFFVLVLGIILGCNPIFKVKDLDERIGSSFETNAATALKNTNCSSGGSAGGFLTHLGSVTLPGTADGSLSEICNDIVVDSNCNIYCGGNTSGSLGEASGGSEDAFVVKLNPNGSLDWIRQIGSASVYLGGDASGYDLCQAIDVDSDNNIYCTGRTTGSLGEANGGSDDIFIWKLDSAGNTIWVKQFGAVSKGSGGDTSASDQSYTLGFDKNNNIVVGGVTGSSFAEPVVGFYNFLVIKLDKDGNVIWNTQFGANTVVPGGNNLGISIPTRIDFDSENNIIMSGASIYLFGSGGGFAEPQSSTVNFNRDPFVIKMNSLGSLEWAVQLGQNTVFPGRDNTGYDECWGISVDSQDNIYSSCFTTGSTVEDVNGSSDFLVLKFDPTGMITGAKQFGLSSQPAGISTAGGELSFGIKIDNNDNLFVAGHSNQNFSEPVSGGYDLVVLKLDNDLNVLETVQFGTLTSAPGGDNSGNEYIQGMDIDGFGNIYITGRTTGNFGEVNAGSTDLFILKLKNDLSL